MSSKTILTIDDDRDILSIVEAILHTNGYRVLTAPNAKAALELLRTEPVDLILLDLAMPEMDGFQFCSAQLDSDGPKVPIIVLSALDTVPLVNDLLTKVAGVVTVMHKPFQPAALLAHIRRVLGDAPPRRPANDRVR
ncbi:MAG: response regulator [Planctomycetes bacterium]|nr:response regulator [Planctomycetota bacterium]